MRRFGIIILLSVIFALCSAHDEITVTFPHAYASTTAATTTQQVSPVERATNAISKAIRHEVTDETKKRVQYLYEQAAKKNVPFDDAVKTIWCESGWECRQSGIWKNGKQEKSYCLAQIHAPSHPNITNAQLWDAYYNIDFMVNNWDTETWYGYDRMTGYCSGQDHIDIDL